MVYNTRRLSSLSHFYLDFFESSLLASLLSLESLASGFEESQFLSVSLCQTDLRNPSFLLPLPVDSEDEGGLEKRTVRIASSRKRIDAKDFAAKGNLLFFAEIHGPPSRLVSHLICKNLQNSPLVAGEVLRHGNLELDLQITRGTEAAPTASKFLHTHAG